MNDERDYFNLEQVAEVCGWTVEKTKNKIFEGGSYLLPAYDIKCGAIVDLKTKVQLAEPTTNSWGETTTKNELNVNFTGIVDIDRCTRASGRFDGIELYADNVPGTVKPILTYNNLSGQQVTVCLKDSFEISEDSLLIRRDNLKCFIDGRRDMMSRYDKLTDKKEIISVRSIPLNTIPRITPYMLVKILAGKHNASECVEPASKEQFIAFTPMSDILAGDYAEEPYREELYAYRLTGDKTLKQVPVYEWHCLFADMEEEKGPSRREWFDKTLAMLPEDVFIRREDLERIEGTCLILEDTEQLQSAGVPAQVSPPATKMKRANDDPLNRTGEIGKTKQFIIDCITHLHATSKPSPISYEAFATLLHTQSLLDKNKRLGILQGKLLKCDKDNKEEFLLLAWDKKPHSAAYIRKQFRRTQKIPPENLQKTPPEK